MDSIIGSQTQVDIPQVHARNCLQAIRSELLRCKRRRFSVDLGGIELIELIVRRVPVADEELNYRVRFLCEVFFPKSQTFSWSIVLCLFFVVAPYHPPEVFSPRN